MSKGKITNFEVKIFETKRALKDRYRAVRARVQMPPPQLAPGWAMPMRGGVPRLCSAPALGLGARGPGLRSSPPGTTGTRGAAGAPGLERTREAGGLAAGRATLPSADNPAPS